MTWAEYYDANTAREPRPMLIDVLDAFEPLRGEAVDLGCGQGVDTLAMLERGWTVLATDTEDDAIARVRARIPAALAPGLRTVVSPMETVELPPVDLVWASYSLFYCDPGRFADVWARIRSSLRPGGRFAGQFLGDRDTWAPQGDRSAFPVEEVRALLDGLEVERFEEEDEDGEAFSGPKHWHLFHVIARVV
jgi:SAM-dependent methyltransferase